MLDWYAVVSDRNSDEMKEKEGGTAGRICRFIPD